MYKLGPLPGQIWFITQFFAQLVAESKQGDLLENDLLTFSSGCFASSSQDTVWFIMANMTFSEHVYDP